MVGFERRGLTEDRRQSDLVVLGAESHGAGLPSLFGVHGFRVRPPALLHVWVLRKSKASGTLFVNSTNTKPSTPLGGPSSPAFCKCSHYTLN